MKNFEIKKDEENTKEENVVKKSDEPLMSISEFKKAIEHQYNKNKKDNIEDGHIEVKMSIKSKMKTNCSKIDESFTDYLYEPYAKPKKK
jgi:hypothetical protein